MSSDKGEPIPDRIKDIAVTSNGFVYVTEKGEVFLASLDQSDDPINQVFKTANLTQPSQIQGQNQLQNLEVNFNIGE